MTIFSKILNGEISCQKVYENEWVFAFHDVNPVAPIHILIIPKKEVKHCGALEDDDALLAGQLLLGAKTIAKSLGIDDFRLVLNTGAGSGQTVFHLHVHLLAGRSFAWPPG